VNILIVTHLYPRHNNSLSGLFVHSEAKYLVENGHQVTILYYSPLLPSFLTRTIPRFKHMQFYNPYFLEGVQVIPLHYPPALSRVSPYFDRWLKKSLFTQSKFIKTNLLEYDIIYAHSLYPDMGIAIDIADYWNKPTMAIMIGSDVHSSPTQDKRIKQMIQHDLPKVNRLLSVCQTLYTEALTVLGAIQTPEVLYMACDVDRFRCFIPIQAPPRRLLFVGALVPTKGVFELIEAMRILVGVFPDLTLSLNGDGAIRKILESRVEKYGLFQNVKFKGFVEHSKLVAEFNSADILVFPSYKEGLSQAVVEAVACERCVVATDVGGISEIAPDSPAFTRISPRDPSAIVQAVTQILNTDIEQLRFSAAQGREFVERRFRPDVNGKLLEAILEKVISSRDLCLDWN
jgi:teichuronic acid biosynthesis glycosyltransferase TuaC